MYRYKVKLSLMVIGLSLIAAYQCAGNTQGDLEAIRELFLTLERGYIEELIHSLGSDDMVTWAVTISDLRKLGEANMSVSLLNFDQAFDQC